MKKKWLTMKVQLCSRKAEIKKEVGNVLLSSKNDSIQVLPLNEQLKTLEHC